MSTSKRERPVGGAGGTFVPCTLTSAPKRARLGPFAGVLGAFDEDADVELPSSGQTAALRGEALALAEAGDMGGSAGKFKLYLQVTPADADAWEMLAQVQMELGQNFDAVKVRIETHMKRAWLTTTPSPCPPVRFQGT